MKATLHTAPGRSRGINVHLAAALLAVTFFGGCSVLRLPHPLRAGDGDWPTLGLTSSRNARDTIAITPPLVEVWRTGISAGTGRGSPLFVDNTVFVGTLRGELCAFRAKDGSRIGRTSLGNAIDGSPVIANNHALVPVAYATESIVRFDLVSGAVVWATSCGDVEASPLLLRDRVYVGNTAGQFLCLDFRTGNIHWRFDLPENTKLKGIRSPAAAADTIVVVGAEDGCVYAFGATAGSLLWSYRGGEIIVAPPVILDSIVVVGTSAGSVIALAVVTGKLLWRSSVDGGVTGGVVVTDHKVIASTVRGFVYALRDSTGEPLWKVDIGGPITAGGLVTGDYFYTGTLRRELVAVRLTDGVVIWRKGLEGRVKTPPIRGSGYLFVTTDAQELIALQPEGAP